MILSVKFKCTRKFNVRQKKVRHQKKLLAIVRPVLCVCAPVFARFLGHCESLSLERQTLSLAVRLVHLNVTDNNIQMLQTAKNSFRAKFGRIVRCIQMMQNAMSSTQNENSESKTKTRT